MTRKVGEESLVLSSWWLKTGIEYKASLGGDGCRELQVIVEAG
ncbi:hypothetical protein [Acidovorax delafieldii]|nr:hypothetical protein [Acidovorax delafieldii]